MEDRVKRLLFLKRTDLNIFHLKPVHILLKIFPVKTLSYRSVCIQANRYSLDPLLRNIFKDHRARMYNNCTRIPLLSALNCLPNKLHQGFTYLAL